MKIVELHLLSDDLAATKTFYRGVFGLPLIEEGPALVSLKAGYTTLVFHAGGEQAFYHVAFNIVPNLYEQTLQWASRQLELIPVSEGNFQADFSNWNAKAFYFFDCNHNICECIARFDLQESRGMPAWKPPIISISEIGLVVDHVAAYCDLLQSKYGLEFFAKQPATPDFAAMGDDEGLLIVVSKSRAWFPTGFLSKQYWLKVILEVGGQKIVLEK